MTPESLEEIKKRAELFKTNTHTDSGKWAADTILQLVAEVERLEKEALEFLNFYCECISSCDCTTKAIILYQATSVQKLTAANKILRECLIMISEYYAVPTYMQNISKPILTTDFVKKALTEADEVMK